MTVKCDIKMIVGGVGMILHEASKQTIKMLCRNAEEGP